MPRKCSIALIRDWRWSGAAGKWNNPFLKTPKKHYVLHLWVGVEKRGNRLVRI